MLPARLAGRDFADENRRLVATSFWVTALRRIVRIADPVPAFGYCLVPNSEVWNSRLPLAPKTSAGMNSLFFTVYLPVGIAAIAAIYVFLSPVFSATPSSGEE